jgi:glycine betaine/proline transport system permease protein
LAKSTILAGINQVILLALSMVVIASMVELKDWKYSVSRNSTERHCKGFESGLGIDIGYNFRTTQAIAKIITRRIIIKNTNK